DDYVYLGNELLRIEQLPLNPDADCNFYAVGGQRVGFLDTTPGHHPMGAPVYKVEIHPPGTTFPPNGLPVFNLNYRNDDGGPGGGSGWDARAVPPPRRRRENTRGGPEPPPSGRPHTRIPASPPARRDRSSRSHSAPRPQVFGRAGRSRLASR